MADNMDQIYQAVKTIHIGCVLASITLFIIRATWAFTASPNLQRIWVKIVPHVVDTFLLLSAVILLIINSGAPLHQPWLMAKIVGLCLYIVFGTMVIKRAPSQLYRTIFLILALLSFGYMVAVAITKTPLPFMRAFFV